MIFSNGLVTFLSKKGSWLGKETGGREYLEKNIAFKHNDF